MSKIFDTQQRIADLLNADAPFFDDPTPAKKLSVITQRVGDIGFQAAQALIAGRAGVVVRLPSFKNVGEAARTLLQLEFLLIVLEQPKTNQTGKPAEAIVERIYSPNVLHWKQNSAALDAAGSNNQNTRFILGNGALMNPPKEIPNLLAYRIPVTTIITLP